MKYLRKSIDIKPGQLIVQVNREHVAMTLITYNKKRRYRYHCKHISFYVTNKQTYAHKYFTDTSYFTNKSFYMV